MVLKFLLQYKGLVSYVDTSLFKLMYWKYIPYCSSYLIGAAYESQSNNIYGVEIDRHKVIISNLRSYITGLPIKVIQGNIISQDYSALPANKVLSNYPLGIRLPS